MPDILVVQDLFRNDVRRRRVPEWEGESRRRFTTAWTFTPGLGQAARSDAERRGV